MGVSILNFEGHATLAVIADAGLVPDPEAITAGFNREFARMLEAVGRRRTKTARRRRAAGRHARREDTH